jgi:hypothetical protein
MYVIYLFIDKYAKFLVYLLIYMYTYIYTYMSRAVTGRFVKIWYWELLMTVQKIHIWLKSVKLTGDFTRGPNNVLLLRNIL